MEETTKVFKSIKIEAVENGFILEIDKEINSAKRLFFVFKNIEDLSDFIKNL